MLSFRPNFTLIGEYCCPCGAKTPKYCDIYHFLTFSGSFVHFTAQIRCKSDIRGWNIGVFYHGNSQLIGIILSRNGKFDDIFHFGGLYSAYPMTDQGQIWHTRVDSQYLLPCQMSTISVYFVALGRRKTPNLTVFFTSTAQRQS